jgi:hypothetical protein
MVLLLRFKRPAVRTSCSTAVILMGSPLETDQAGYHRVGGPAARAGYGTSGRIYDLEEAIRAAHRWIRERDARGEPFLSGMFTRGEVVYAGSAGGDAHDREPVAIFIGEVLPLYAGDLDDDTVRMLLNELASAIGRTLEQEEVHVGYRDRTWTLKRSQ